MSKKEIIAQGIIASATPTIKQKTTESPCSCRLIRICNVGNETVVKLKLKLGFPVAVLRIDSYMNYGKNAVESCEVTLTKELKSNVFVKLSAL